jgi:hypothetical protein
MWGPFIALVKYTIPIHHRYIDEQSIVIHVSRQVPPRG